jgi:hypothetical protein
VPVAWARFPAIASRNGPTPPSRTTSNATTGRLAAAATAVPDSATRREPRANSRIASGRPNCGLSQASASASVARRGWLVRVSNAPAAPTAISGFTWPR